MTTNTRPARRPMIAHTGTVSDLRQGDYVDSIGDGVTYKRIEIGSVIHRVTTGYALGSFVERTYFEFMSRKGNFAFAADAPVSFRRFEV